MIHLLKITSSLAISASLMLTSIQVPHEAMSKVTLDHNGFIATYLTGQTTVADFLAERGIQTGSGTQINLELNAPLENAPTIVVDTPESITIRVDGRTIHRTANNETVAMALKAQGIELGSHDWINARLGDPVTDGMVLNIQRVQVREMTQAMVLTHGEEIIKSDSLLKGKEEITEGTDGERIIVTRTTLVDGVEYASEVVSTTVTSEPVATRRVIGTKVVKAPVVKKVSAPVKKTSAPVKKVSAPVKPKTTTTVKPATTTQTSDSDKNWKTFTLSFYTNLPSENGGYTITASGKSLRFGMVASNFYSLGTEIYLNGYGTMTVEDRGGSNFNNSYRLDVFIPRRSGESNSEYLRRVNNMGMPKVKGYVR